MIGTVSGLVIDKEVSGDYFNVTILQGKFPQTISVTKSFYDHCQLQKPATFEDMVIMAMQRRDGTGKPWIAVFPQKLI